MMHAHSLLYIPQSGSSRAVNGNYPDAESQAAGYARQAMQLHRSLAASGSGDLTVHTNNPARVTHLLSRLPGERPVITELDPKIQVPRSITFYEAHYKIDVIRALGLGRDKAYSVLLDLDVNCRHEVDEIWSKGTNGGGPLLYDISDQVMSAYGFERVKSDLELLVQRSLRPSEVRWYGGEFIAGDGYFFSELHQAIMSLWPRYCQIYPELHHHGDEMLIAGAVASALQGRASDAGASGIIARYWTVPTKHEQISVRTALQAKLLHMPASKQLLERMATLRNPVVPASALRWRAMTRRARQGLSRFIHNR